MSRAFLSHSSLDKDFVREVYASLGAAKAVYDAVTFRRNSDLVEQIEKGIDGADVYVLFSSRAALDSKWVKSEIDLAHEMKIRCNIRSFLIFQLDDTPWSELPSWMSRYVVSCPPSPEQAALRILDELNTDRRVSSRCIGREDEVRLIATEVLEREQAPTFLYLSGPIGIGRRTLADEVFKQIYPDIASHKIRVTVDSFDDIQAIHRKLLKFSSNWRARELFDETERFSSLSPQDQLVDLALLIEKVSVTFRQIVMFDVGSTVLDDDGRPLPWFSALLDVLPQADYPYLWVISKRFLSDRHFENGIFHALQPLDEINSRYLFKLLLNEFGITFPSSVEKENIEQSIIGHPGLINKVVNYLRINPAYKPNKTHNRVVKLIAEQVEAILRDFISRNPGFDKAVALFAETGIMSYEDVRLISSNWPEFERAVEALMDAGMVIGESGEYFLASYIQRIARDLPANNAPEIKEARKALFSHIENIGEEDFVPLSVLDSRIVEMIASGKNVSGFIRNLIMPSQQLKAARRCYDREKYSDALRLAKDCFEQSIKLSDRGKLEAWRLIGLSAIRIPDDQGFEYFESNLTKLPAGKARDAIHEFARGFRARFEGDLRRARASFRNIERAGSADYHVYRELAYIFTFEGAYEDALLAVEKGLKLAPDNVFVLDMKAFALLEKYKKSRNPQVLRDIDDCLEKLRIAEVSTGTRFYIVRASTREVVVTKDATSLTAAFKDRAGLPVMARVSLLALLSFQDKKDQYVTLLNELGKTRRTNKLADIEIARIEIERLALDRDIPAARHLLAKFGNRFPEDCVTDLRSFITRAEAFAKV